MDAGLTEADDGVRTTGDDPHGDRIPARRRVDRIDPERGERRVHHTLEYRHQMRLPLISTRGRVQIGSGVRLHVQHDPARELLVDRLLGVARQADGPNTTGANGSSTAHRIVEGT